ncbi:MAG: MFS transporter, partial [Planctomycetota bacterium]
ALFIILFVPVFNVLWRWLRSINMEPSIPVKFAFGVILLGIGFFVFPWGATYAVDGMVPMTFLVLAYLLHTLGELCLSPVGLSMVTKLSPARIVAFVMGFWFLSSSLAHLLGKFIAQETASDDLTAVAALEQYSGVFTQVGWMAVGAGLFLLVFSPIVKKWMHGVD